MKSVLILISLTALLISCEQVPTSSTAADSEKVVVQQDLYATGNSGRRVATILTQTGETKKVQAVEVSSEVSVTDVQEDGESLCQANDAIAQANAPLLEDMDCDLYQDEYDNFCQNAANSQSCQWYQTTINNCLSVRARAEVGALDLQLARQVAFQSFGLAGLFKYLGGQNGNLSESKSVCHKLTANVGQNNALGLPMQKFYDSYCSSPCETFED